MEDRSTDTASQKRVVTRMLIVLCIIVGSVVIILATVAYLILSKRWRQQSCELCSLMHGRAIVLCLLHLMQWLIRAEDGVEGHH